MPTALVALGTRILSGALRAARRTGRRVPSDLSVIGIGTKDAFALADPALTTLRFNIDQAAQAAAQLMLERLGGTSGPRRSVTVPLDLVLGNRARRRRSRNDAPAAQGARRARPRRGPLVRRA
jgi:LacI family transcriptional regulator